MAEDFHSLSIKRDITEVIPVETKDPSDLKRNYTKDQQYVLPNSLKVDLSKTKEECILELQKLKEKVKR